MNLAINILIDTNETVNKIFKGQGTYEEKLEQAVILLARKHDEIREQIFIEDLRRIVKRDQ